MTDTKFYIVLSKDLKDIYKPSLYNAGITFTFYTEELIFDDMVFLSLNNIDINNHIIIGFDKFGQITENENDIDISNFKFSFTDKFMNDNKIYMIYPDADIDKHIMDNLDNICDLDIISPSEFCEKLSNEVTVLDSNESLKEYYLESLGVTYPENNKSFLLGTMDYETVLQTMKNADYNIIDTDTYWLVFHG